MGAYLTLDPVNCVVYLSNRPKTGQSQWFGGLPDVGFSKSWTTHDFNIQFPGYISVPPHCVKVDNSGSPPPNYPLPPGGFKKIPIQGDDSDKSKEEGPITGDPPPEECGEGYGTFTADLDDQMNEDGQPIVMGMTPLPTLSGDDPAYTQRPYFQVRTGEKHAIIDAVHEGTGAGVLCVHPPELQDYQLRGTDDNGDAGWPTNISESTLMLLNSVRDDGTTGDFAVTNLAFGTPLRDTDKPGDGWVIYEDLSSANELIFQATSDAGGYDDSPALVLNGEDVTIAGKLTVDGMIDPPGLELTPQASNPNPAAGGTAADTIWISSGNNHLYRGSTDLEAAGGGSGDVVGPASATDDNIATFDSTTGKLIQDSGVAISDIPSGNMKYFRATKNSTAQVTTGAFADITGWDEDNADSPFSFNTTTGELTFDETGLYMVIVDVQGEGATNRTQIEVEMQFSPLGAGYASQAEMIWRNYSARNTTQNDGGVHGSFVREFTATDLIKFRVLDVGAAATINQDKARIYAVKMAF